MVGTVGTVGTDGRFSNHRLLKQARHMLQQNISIIPIKCDGSKSPACHLLKDRSWKPYQKRLIGIEEINKWFHDNEDEAEYGIGVIGGAVSGGLEILDIDTFDLVDPFMARLETAAPGLFARLYKVMTPRPGLHCYYRVECKPSNCSKLAMVPVIDSQGKSTSKTLIEIKAEGGYVLAQGCPPACHPTGRTYQRLEGPKICQIPVLNADERQILIGVARSFNEVEEAVRPHRMLSKKKTPAFFDEPWERFNADALWQDILKPHRWTLVSRSNDGTEYFRRPGSDNRYSAAAHPDPPSRLRVFSQNAHPFESVVDSRITYSKFDAFKLLNCNGNFKVALSEILKMGYGESPLPPFMQKPPQRAPRKRQPQRRR